MKQLIRLTESDLHKIIRESVKRALRENHGEPESYEGLIYNNIIEDYKAQEIAEEYGISEQEAAAEWFKGVFEEYNFEKSTVPKWREFVMNIPELNSKLYHDYGAGYYFLVKNADPSSAPMAMESIVRQAVRGSLNRLIETDCAGVMQTGCGDAPKGTNPEAGQYTVPFGKVQRRKIYQPKDKNAGGDVTKQSSNVDMSPAMKRKDGKGGSISIPKR